MRPEIAEVVESLRATRRPDFRQLIADAGIDGDQEPAAWPEAVEPYRWFLGRIGDGVKLTSAGWLPPAVVLDTMQQLGWDAGWIGKGNREDLTPPAAELRETARRLRLVRVHRGELKPTDAGRRLRNDPVALWWHIAARLPVAANDPGRFAGVLWLLALAAGRGSAEQHVADGMAAFGWAHSSGGPVDRHDVHVTIRETYDVLDRRGVLVRGRESVSPAGVDLARAALRAVAPLPRRQGKQGPALELEITLRDVEPPVRRRIVVPESVDLRRLHDLLQAAMGWQNQHLYLFAIDGREYGEVEDWEELGDVRTTLSAVAAVGTVFRYDYDFGDGWQHDVRIVGTTTADGPHCLDGVRACPPEDCGGPHGYARLLDVLGDPRHPEHEELVEWLGRPLDPGAFDVEAADRAMIRAARRR